MSTADDNEAYIASLSTDQMRALLALMGDEIKELRAAAPSARPSVPPGWKLVPKDATEPMIRAGVLRMFEDKRYSCAWEDVFFNAWSAMLTAAPEFAATPQAPAPSVAQTEPETMPPIRTGGSLNIPDVVRRASRAAAPSVAQEPDCRQVLSEVLALARLKWGNLDSDANTVFEKAHQLLATPPSPAQGGADEAGCQPPNAVTDAQVAEVAAQCKSVDLTGCVAVRLKEGLGRILNEGTI